MPTPKSISILGTKEQVIAHLLAEGKQNKEAAEIAGISVNTVRCHIQRIYRKLGIASRAELIRVVHGLDTVPRTGPAPSAELGIKSEIDRARFAKGTILAVLKADYDGTPVQQITEKYGVSREQLNLWRYKYSSLSRERLESLNQVYEENNSLKARIAELEAMVEELRGKSGDVTRG